MQNCLPSLVLPMSGSKGLRFRTLSRALLLTGAHARLPWPIYNYEFFNIIFKILQKSIDKSFSIYYYTRLFETEDRRKMAKNEQKQLFDDQNIEKMNFEEALVALNQIVENIESGDIQLEDSLKQYETGMAMIKRCRKILTDAETRIEKLSEKDKK